MARALHRLCSTSSQLARLRRRVSALDASDMRLLSVSPSHPEHLLTLFTNGAMSIWSRVHVDNNHGKAQAVEAS